MAARTLMLLNPARRKRRKAARKKPVRRNPAKTAAQKSRTAAGKKAWKTRLRNEAAKKRAATLAKKKRAAPSAKPKRKKSPAKKKGGRTSMATMTKKARSLAGKKAWRKRKARYGKTGLPASKRAKGTRKPPKRRISRPGGKRGTKARAKGKYHRPRVYRTRAGRWMRKKPGTRGRSYTFPRPTRLNPRRKKYRRNPLPTLKSLLDPKKMINGMKLGASVLGGYAIINTFDTQISSKLAAKVLPNNAEAQFWLSEVLNAMGTILISHMIRGQSTKFADAVMAGGFFVIAKDVLYKVMPTAVPLIEGQGMGAFRQVGEGVGAFQQVGVGGMGDLEYDGM